LTGKPQPRQSWQLTEQHGLWWAYEGELPPPEAFRTHGRSRHLAISGRYPSRAVAEALLRRHLGRARIKVRRVHGVRSAERSFPAVRGGRSA